MSFRALRRMAAEIDEQHRESMATIADDLGEAHLGGSAEQVQARRSFLKRVATGGAIAFGATVVPVTALAEAALAQTSGTTPGSTPGTTAAGSGSSSSSKGPKIPAADLQVVLFAQSVELAAVAAYDAVLKKNVFEAGPLEDARTFRRHHAEHAVALGTFAGDRAVTTPNARLVAELAPRIDAAKTPIDVANVLYGLEDGAAATYAFALGELQDWQVAGAASTILPIEGQHAIVWSTVIDDQPDQWAKNIKTYVPNFQSSSGAFEPSKYA